MNNNPWLTLPLVIVSVSIAAGLVCEEGLVPHRTFGADQCCRPIKIPKGYQYNFQGCDENKEVAFEECPPDSYMSVELSSQDGFKCHPKVTCSNSGLVSLSDGSFRENRVCVCHLEEGYYQTRIDIRKLPICRKKSCDVNKELQKNGKCTECKYGFHKPERGFHQCQPMERPTSTTPSVKPQSSTLPSKPDTQLNDRPGNTSPRISPVGSKYHVLDKTKKSDDLDKKEVNVYGHTLPWWGLLVFLVVVVLCITSVLVILFVYLHKHRRDVTINNNHQRTFHIGSSSSQRLTQSDTESSVVEFCDEYTGEVVETIPVRTA